MMQGVEVPAQAVQPEAFFALTQRKQAQNKVSAFAGFGSTDSFKLRQQGIIAGIDLRITGTITLATTPTVTPTFRWPFDLVKKIRVNANGSANLVNCSGAKLKARALMDPDFNDRGVSKNVSNPSAAGASVQGTMFLNSEDQGTSGANKLIPGQAQTNAAAYTVELYYFIPIAADQITLRGAIFAQTAATELNVDIDWASQNELFTVGAGTVTPALTYSAVPVVWSIPVLNGMQLVPDLSEFHSLIETRSNVLANGDNDIDLIGFGAGRKLLRVFWQVWNGATPQIPLVVNATNYGPLSWVYGLNEVPESLPSGQAMRTQNDRIFDADIGAIWGFAAWDFANKFALRDIIDGNKVTNLRLRLNIPSGVTLTNGVAEFVQETLSIAPVSA
jgi:hypothetical protein